MFWVAGLRVLEDLRLKKMRHANIFMALSLGYNHQQMSEGQRQKSSEFCNRTASESNVYLNSFHYPDHSYKDQAFDTLSLDSSDSMETSISTGGNSVCSPDNMSRYPAPATDWHGLCPPHAGVSTSTGCLLSPFPPQR